MSVTSENEHEPIITNLTRVTISSSWLNAWHNTEVALFVSWAILQSGTVSLILVVHVLQVKLTTSTHLSLSHLCVVSIKTFIGIFDDETVLHADTCWADKARFVLVSWVIVLL